MMSINDNKQNNKLSGRYEIIEQVGIGGMSYVYKAYDTKRKRIVAIKVLKDELAFDQEFVKKFQSEALACKDIRQKNVISAYDVVDEDNMHYIVMEYIEGTTLNKYISDKGKLSNEETIDISLQVAKGIQAAHKKGIIHRDIKPQNIVIDNKNVAKITDFGIARAITSTTKNISVIGTVHYISPEQVRNTKVDFRSDIYSFGCTMYEMITGTVPFEGETPLEIIVSHLRCNIENPRLKNSSIYKSLEKIILKATRMIPKERYQTIEEMINDLDKALIDKEGTYIKGSVYDDDKEGETVVITNEDMKVIKAVSEKFTNKTSYKTDESELTPEQKKFIDRYIENGSFRQHQMTRRIVLGSIIAIVFLIVIMLFIALDTRRPLLHNGMVASNSIAVDNIVRSLEGLNIELARNLTEEYGIKLNVVGEEYSDTIEHGKIIKIVASDLDNKKTIDVIASKGSEVIDFTDVEALQNTSWRDMMILLNERKLKYVVSEIYNNDIPRGYIIGVNKNNSSEEGALVFTVSQGASTSLRIMPNLVKKSISEARDLLEANELLLGSISFVRDDNIPENYVITQSVEAGREINSGSSVDLFLSCGPDGTEYVANSNVKWHAELSQSYRVGKANTPEGTASNDKVILQVRLMQETNQGIVYTELLEPEEYKVGTILPLIFKNIEGEENVQTGQVQVVDVVNDTVVYSTIVKFTP